MAGAGCARDPVAEVPGHLKPGNAIEVAGQALSGGSGAGGITIGAAPMIDYQSPNIPIRQDGVTDILYALPYESLDGESERDGHWVYVTVAAQSFTRAWRHADKSLFNREDASALPRRDLQPHSARLPRDTHGEPPAGMTYMQGTQPTTRVSVYEVDPAQGTAQAVGTATVPRSQVPVPAAGATTTTADQQRDVMRMLERFNELNAQRTTARRHLPVAGSRAGDAAASAGTVKGNRWTRRIPSLNA